VLGPVTGGFIADRLGLQTVYIIAGVIFIVSTIMVFFISKDTTHQHPDDSGSNKIGLLKNSRFMAFLLMVLVTFLILYLPQPFTPSFLQNQQGFSRSMIGILGAFGSLGNAVAMLALGHLKPVTGFIIGQLWVLLYVTLFLVGDLPFWFGLGYFFFGGYRLCRSMVLAIARPLVHPRQTGLAYGMIETAAAVSVIAAPILAGFLYKADPYSLYRVAVILSVGLILFSLFIYKILIDRRNKQDAPRP
jgi:nitrate/nitrite transporter NarK